MTLHKSSSRTWYAAGYTAGVFVLALLAMTCTTKHEKKLLGVWHVGITPPFPMKPARELDGYRLMDGWSAHGTPVLNIYSTESFTFTSQRGYLEGNWRLDAPSSRIIFTATLPGRKDSVAYVVERLRGEAITLKSESGDTTQALPAGILELSLDKFKYADPADDLYTQANNVWRRASTRPEDSLEIQKRLKDNIHYIKIYLNNPRLRDESSVDLRGVDSPFKIARNGVVLKPLGELPAKWVHVFHDSTQAAMAYRILSRAFKQPVEFKNNVGWLELDIDILRQLEARL